jgi:hypothetical protein
MDVSLANIAAELRTECLFDVALVQEASSANLLAVSCISSALPARAAFSS